MSWEDEFLNWFADQKLPIREQRPRVGEMEYYLFSTAFTGGRGRSMAAFGASKDRKIAAIKCAAESAERRFMAEIFDGSENEFTANRIQLSATKVEPSESIRVVLPPRRVRSSNGWAVHSTEAGAIQSACREALERHLLLKSFYLWEWAGVRHLRDFLIGDIHVHLMTSRLSLGGYVSGMVAAKSPLYPGVSFGYCLGDSAQTHKEGFWEPALFEAIGKIVSLKGNRIEVPEGPNSWLFKAVKDYLESPFDLNQFKEGRESSVMTETNRTGYLKVFDLKERWKLDFPLYAAFCWGGNLIPLTDASVLDESSQPYLSVILNQNEIRKPIPMRHPVL